MSTRATYSFQSEDHYFPETCIYIHDDGYMQGAAVYFYNFLIYPKESNCPTIFLRANENAELTTSHQFHTDTDYRYTYNEKNNLGSLIVHEINNKNWEVCFSGNVYDFVNKYCKKTNFHPFLLVNLRYKPAYYNNITAKLTFDNALNTLLSCNQNNNNIGAYWEGALQEVKNCLFYFPTLREHRIKDLEKILVYKTPIKFF